VYGDAAVIEYRQPAGVVGDVRLETRGLLHFYRMIQDPRAEQFKNIESDPCEVDVNCPEGGPWSNEKHAVVRLSLVSGGGAGLCSGTLVNNTAMDCKGYVLTAMHCTEGSSASNLLASSARFNFAKSGCGTGLGSTTQNSTGLYLRADSNDGGGATGSDFALIELEDPIPASWTVYYAGWDATDNVPVAIVDSLYGAKAVCIHHPAGDYMKISHASQVTKGTWQASDRHWRTVWMATETEHGVTEGGSSGSPIFSPSHQIIGTLTGGGSFCNTPTSPDYYGRMAKHWTGNFNPNPASEKLKVWLDPGNLGWLTMDGATKGTSALPCQPVSVKEELKFDDVVVYPSLIQTTFQVQVANNPWIQQAVVFDSNGRQVAAQNFTSGQLTFDASEWANGVYYLSVRQNNGSYVTKKLVVAHS
jgi:V8-like Glu-specific endopeptidase